MLYHRPGESTSPVERYPRQNESSSSLGTLSIKTSVSPFTSPRVDHPSSGSPAAGAGKHMPPKLLQRTSRMYLARDTPLCDCALVMMHAQEPCCESGV